MAVKQVRFNVKNFGAKGDGTTDDSAAFIACRTAIIASRSTLPLISGGGDGNRRPDYIFYIPAGKYLITQPEALMSSADTGVTMGLTYEGDGKGVTWINFAPTVADSYLLKNNNTFMHMTFRDIYFAANTTNANWMESTSTAFAQNYAFERCAWGGKWNYGLVLLGTNTNSEMSWHHCNVNGEWNVFLYVPDSVGTQGDQFVNYNFFACNFEIGAGSFIDMYHGGSIGIWGGSWMYYSGTSVGGTMFNLRNSLHNNGACRFMMAGTRVELPKSFCKLIYCEWPHGAVGFFNVDNSTQQWQTVETKVVNSIFSFGNNGGPVVSWVNCTLQGQHEYRFGTGGANWAGRINYENCEFWHYDNAHEFIVLTGTSKGNAPLIRFNMCHGAISTSQSKYAFDTTVGWNTARSGLALQRAVSISTGGDHSELPQAADGDIDIWLPMGAVITRVFHYMEAGSVASTSNTNWTYTVQNYETTPSQISQYQPTNPSLGGQKTTDTFYVCDSDVKRHIRVTAGSGVNERSWGMTVIEYLG